MTAYQIICTQKSTCPNGHHVINVGTGSGNTYSRLWPVAQVYAAMTLRDTFYTQVGGKTARVSPDRCACGVDTLRTHPDDSKANNLDALPKCE